MQGSESWSRGCEGGEWADKQGGYRQGPGLVLNPCHLWQSEGPL